MASFLALAGVIVLCIVLGRIFRPRYGAGRGCTGRALQTRMDEDASRKAPPAP